MSYQKLPTNKLFFNKWPYKICCQCDGASMIIRLNPLRLALWLVDNDTPLRGHWSVDKQALNKFYTKVKPFFDKELQIRAEGKHFNIFCKDPVLRDKIIKALKPWIQEIYEPKTGAELEFMLENGKKRVLCNALPKEKYNYRVYIKPSMDISLRASFFTWTEKYGGKINISDSSKRWLEGRKFWAQAPFMYVEDDATLTMVALFLGNNIRVIEKFIPRDSINTNLNQEITCQP